MYKTLIRPVLDQLDSETWHNNVKHLMCYAEKSPYTLKILEYTANLGKRLVDERLNVELAGIKFENPLFVGAGWDKEGVSVKALHAIGFAGVEVGSVLSRAQPGNPKPRQHMLSPEVCLNSLGFNSPGMDAVLENLKKYEYSGIPIGISLGINKDVAAKDAPIAHAIVAERLFEYATYFALNVSSPNTSGLRDLQDKKLLEDNIIAVNEAATREETRIPLFIKIAPELNFGEIDDIIELCVDNEVAGIIATNTSNNTDIKSKYGKKWSGVNGGVSGADYEYQEMSTRIISHIFSQSGDKLYIIGVGGVCDPDSALDKIRAGASMLQIVTGLRGEGLGVASKINKGILKFLESNKLNKISDIIGIDKYEN